MPVRTPSRSASTFIVRLMPSSPPTPVRVKPKPSWIGGNSAVMMISSEKPGLPSGSRVVSSPIALRLSTANDSSRTPGVLAAVGVEEQVAAAGDRPGVDLQPDAGRWLEPGARRRRRPSAPSPLVSRSCSPKSLHAAEQRPQRRGDLPGQGQRGRVRAEDGGERRAGAPRRAERRRARAQHDAEAVQAAADTQTLAAATSAGPA